MAENLREEVERLRVENERLRAEVERLRDELHRLGRYLAKPPPATSAPEAGGGEVGWGYQRGDLEDDLGDD